ncbi:MAG: hypothetical protein J7K73_01055 [Nanoarchaeota archaeon]|nr:hypothetical protein [Nanoarchaeota archaeon]
MSRGWITVVAIIILIVAAALAVFLIMPKSSVQGECRTSMDCRLSLCDCKCHPVGQTPEETKGIVCGKNCQAWYGVKGCTCEDGSCKEVY